MQALDFFFMDENSHLLKRVDVLCDKLQVTREALMRTQQYVLELECRLEAMEEVVNRIVDRESLQMRDALVENMHAVVENGGYVTDDLERILEGIEAIEAQEQTDWIEDLFGVDV